MRESVRSTAGRPEAFARVWHEALYGSDGFYRRSVPAEHFRTSAHVGAALAHAVLRLVRREGLREVVDLGSGAGELLAALHASAEPGELDLVGVELRERPRSLPEAIAWTDEIPAVCTGLLVAHEWLDDVPCEVVEVDDGGQVREVLVDAEGGERLGEPVCSGWLDHWWPLDGAAPGDRAEIGLARDDAWASAVATIAPGGVAVAVDYGHLRSSRPRSGSVRAYAHGREVPVALDGSCDVTAHVAVDAVAERVGGCLVRQRDALRDLGVVGDRPSLDLARTDPTDYVAALSRAGEEAELLASGGLGDHWWIVSDH